MDDDVLDDHRHTDAESFGEWIEQVAESRGVSEDELLHQLMSSYWMMDELATVIDDLEIDAGRGISGTGSPAESGRSTTDPESKSDPSDRERASRSGSELGDPEEAPSPADYDDGVIPLIETLKDWKSERTQPESSSVDDNLIDLIKVIQGGNQAGGPGQSAAETRDRDGPDAGGVSETVQLIRALKEFNDSSGGGNIQEQLAAEQKHRELADQIEDLEAEIEAASEEVQQVDEATQQRTREVAKQLQQLDSRLDAIEETLQDKPDAEAVDQIEGKLGEVADQITKVRGEVDSRFDEVDTEFENVEQILNHLFDQVDENDSRTETLNEQLSRIQSRMHVLDDLEAAKDLQREAHDAGVSTATCGSCREAVDVDQLTEPACPYCSAEFDGLTEEKKWGLFRHQVLTDANADNEP
jgi:predicted Zn-ribbon and HTH transcriptional regulator